ncbi:MAG: cyclic nucleotide-binding domain-containing protein [Verrucomicrobiota bacterium]
MVDLKSSKLCSSLTSAECDALRQVAQSRHFLAREPIFREGDQGDGIYIVQQGLVQISALVTEGERRNLSHFGPGEFFGEMAVLDNEPRSATATAETDTEVYFIPQSDLLQMLERSPKLAISLVRQISLRLREFNRQYIQETLQAERLALVGRFARSIVHDLKNPLTVIGFAADMLDADHATPEMRRTAKTRIRKQVDRLTSMIKELLEFTRMSQGSIVLAQADFAVYIQQLLEEIRGELDGTLVKFECENAPPSVDVLMEPDRLSHVFFNLIHNAVEAMPNGGKLIMRFAVKGDSLTTEIEDTGPGIAPEIATRLFEPFATFGKPQGTGLGLSICRKIMEDHRGQVAVRNEPGRGAIFSLTLPLRA